MMKINQKDIIIIISTVVCFFVTGKVAQKIIEGRNKGGKEE